MTSRPIRTCTIRNRRPIILERAKTWRTCSGVASVATSKSLGILLSSRSRTQPPTSSAWKPLLLSSSIIFRAPLLTDETCKPCSAGRKVRGIDTLKVSLEWDAFRLMVLGALNRWTAPEPVSGRQPSGKIVSRYGSIRTR